MACSSIRGLQRICLFSLLRRSSPSPPSHTPILPNPQTLSTISTPFNLTNPRWVFKNWSSSHGSVNLVISQGGQPRFETNEIEPPKKEKWQTKKRLKMQRKREKKKRNAANKRDPRRIGVKGGRKVKQRFVSPEERIKCKIEKAKIKEGLLIERLKRYEVPKLQGPMVKQDDMTGEERFYMKKMAQKGSNYVPVGRRGVFGGVILNMHMHWKKHETVEVICKPCKPGQVRDYANEIARLSGGIPIHIIGDDTIIFYRGKNYVQPEVMSPIDTLSKKRALEKSKYEQSLESVRRFIAIAEKELELYYRHVALYGDPNSRNPNLILDSPIKGSDKRKKVEMLHKETHDSTSSGLSHDLSTMENDSTDQEVLSDTEDDSEKEELSFRETVSQSRGNSFSQGKKGKSIRNSDHHEFRAVNLKV